MAGRKPKVSIERKSATSGRSRVSLIKKSNAKRAPTERKGRTAQADLLGQVVLFGNASKRVKLPYYEYQISRSGTAGAISNYFISANGIFDPNVTGTGHQPMGFDTMMTYYEQYTVMASKITVCFCNNSLQAVRAGISLTPDTTAGVIGDIVENGLIKFVALDAPNVGTPGACAGGGGARIKSVSMDCNVASYFGRKTQREMLNDTNLYGTAGANPTEQVYFDIITWGAFSADNTTVLLDFVVEYDVIFWEPRKVSQQ